MSYNLTIVVGIFIAGTAVIKERRSTEDAVAILDAVIGKVCVTDST
jgi:hypothetical protein